MKRISIYSEKHLVHHYLFRKKCAFFYEGIMMLNFLSAEIQKQWCLLRKKRVGLIISSEQILIFFWRNNDGLDFFSENQEALMLSFLSKPGVIISSGKQSMTSLFLQKKISIFFWRNNDVLDFYLKKYWGTLFFFEEIMMHLIFFWRNDELLHFFWRNNELLDVFLKK